MDDLHAFNLSAMAWTDISAAAGSGTPPSGRFGHGFTSEEGRLYVHGGYTFDATGSGPECGCLLSP